jgi:predicted PurR-regulated permease PerM
VIFALLIVAGLLGFGIYSVVSDQAHRMKEQGPAMMSRFREQLDQLQQRFPWIGEQREQLDPAAALKKAGQVVMGGLIAGGRGVAATLVVFMLAIFTAANASSYLKGFLTLFSPPLRPRVEQLAHGSACVLRRWFGSQLLVVSISGAIMAVALRALGIEYWLLIAMMTALLDLIPFVGALVTGAMACLVTLGTAPEKIWGVVLVCVAVQQIENHVTLPIIMKERVRLPEAHLLVFMLAMGTAFGFPGVFVAPAIFAVAHYLYGAAYLPWIEKREDRHRGTARTAAATRHDALAK